jgi:hypothetical protein
MEHKTCNILEKEVLMSRLILKETGEETSLKDGDMIVIQSDGRKLFVSFRRPGKKGGNKIFLNRGTIREDDKIIVPGNNRMDMSSIALYTAMLMGMTINLEHELENGVIFKLVKL